ncbi:hypothetical protein Patl1_00371 [Pistacia atlantica]|uniref:Uncharacterized protein n=1 Tax=Pistacia atlantica TaxID=434234 RepID=A0ACC1CAA4_9ROSI|nr:hypothetical protein Patl1_00371 [Pistacia atlantica]
MNVMRRLKSIASGRTSISSDPGGDSGTKRAKVEKETEVDGGRNKVERSSTSLEQHMASTSLEPPASTSNISTFARTERSGYDQLPKEMHEMRIRDDRNANHDDKDMEPAVVNGKGTEAGQIIATTVGGRNGQPKQVIWTL